MPVRIVAGQDVAIAGWAGEQLGVQFQEPYTAFGFVDASGSLCGACVLNDYYPGGNVEITYVGPQSITRRIASFMARFCFEELQATRVTAKTKRSNVTVRRLLPKGGFAFEYTQKRYFGPRSGDDALVFVLFRENAGKWLRRPSN
ncbi:GNAT family protein [Rhizobium sp. BK251]|uniref:GNAT family N-acetyltransferase n=1 Tax=Rhizobium sp. BK251 TaxID=2512125 RepID=UPI001042A4F1|nr:GNAT family protein [Rhizobium sp. BK251]TCL70535.1 hypothetical protein EV286_107410 [Rhizobium sp. BK251]